jgi:F-type H+-transporting ATPase subunit epsilon
VLKVSVVSPERVLFEGEARSVVAPAYDGLVGVLPRHAPMLTLLGEGRLVIRGVEEERALHVAGGFVQVNRDVVRVVAERAG